MSLSGHIDFFTVDLISGWAWDPERPDEPIGVTVMEGDSPILDIKADRFRPDLTAAGIGNGCHAFSLVDLHHLIPWSRRNVSVARATDGVVIANPSRSLIATGSPSLLVSREEPEASIAFGYRRYALSRAGMFADMAAWLPLSLAEDGDDILPLCGQARWQMRDGTAHLVLESADEPPIDVPIDDASLAGPQLRICRGRPREGGWAGAEMVLEVENAIGIGLRCLLPERPGADSKQLRVQGLEAEPGLFELARGREVLVNIPVHGLARHRLRLSTQPEPNGRDGFQICGLDVISRQEMAG